MVCPLLPIVKILLKSRLHYQLRIAAVLISVPPVVNFFVLFSVKFSSDGNMNESVQGLVHFYKEVNITKPSIFAVFPVLLQFSAAQKESNQADNFSMIRSQFF